MSSIAILPARGGSKRIPRKNVGLFCGKPMIAYPIEAALRSGVFDQVVVSTDDPEIAAVAREHGALTPFVRPPEISQDYSDSHSVMVHALGELQKLGITPRYACKIFPTSPMLLAKDLSQGLALLQSAEAEFVMAVVEFPYPIDRALWLAGDGSIAMRWPENFSVRSQDLPACVHEAGQFVWGKAEAFRAGNPPLLGRRTLPFTLPRHRVQDIDVPEDWAHAEILYRAHQQSAERKEASPPPSPAPPSPTTPKPAKATPELRLNGFGFYEIVQKPSAEELGEYYAAKYYQNSIRTHRPVYPPEEIRFRHHKLAQKLLAVSQLRSSAPGRFLDVGAGEGFSLACYQQQGWDVTGLDFSEHGCRTHHPACLPHLIVGDIYHSLAQLQAQGRVFDLILLDNVLEHVLDPLDLLRRLRPLLTEDGVLIVEVPNDFSAIQTHLLEQGRLTRPFWVAVPDHLSYFNRTGLANLAEAAGLQEKIVLADFPIDFALFNDRTNYVNDPSAGKGCHRMRVEIDNLMHEVSPKKTNSYYEALADLGMGRQIIAFFQPAP